MNYRTLDDLVHDKRRLTCFRCDAPLKDALSRRLGYGPECRKSVYLLDDTALELAVETQRRIEVDRLRFRRRRSETDVRLTPHRFSA